MICCLAELSINLRELEIQDILSRGGKQPQERIMQQENTLNLPWNISTNSRLCLSHTIRIINTSLFLQLPRRIFQFHYTENKLLIRTKKESSCLFLRSAATNKVWMFPVGWYFHQKQQSWKCCRRESEGWNDRHQLKKQSIKCANILTMYGFMKVVWGFSVLWRVFELIFVA